jgi:hypothetical protein
LKCLASRLYSRRSAVCKTGSWMALRLVEDSQGTCLVLPYTRRKPGERSALGGGPVLPHHPNICSEGPWRAPVSGLAPPEFGFPLSPTTSHTSSHTSHEDSQGSAPGSQNTEGARPLAPFPFICAYTSAPLDRGGRWCRPVQQGQDRSPQRSCDL